MATKSPRWASVEKLKDTCDPFTKVCWWEDIDTPLTREEVLKARAIRPREAFEAWPPPKISRAVHAGRIKWFVKNGWTKPIAIDVGIPSMGCYVEWPIVDGNHRFAAAIVRGDEWIRADFGGDARLFKLFGARVTKPRNSHG